MSERIKETTVRSGDTERKITEYDDDRSTAATRDDGQNLAERIIWFIAGTIITLLLFRFVLILLGANQGNGFVDFIYGISYPFARPFFGIFGYNLEYGVSRVEISTLVAIAVYAVLAWGLSKLVNLGRSR